MKDKRILYVSSEVVPYLPETEIASTAFNVAKKAHSKGVQTRIFMPVLGLLMREDISCTKLSDYLD